MCGRYYVDDDTARAVRRLIRDQEKKVRTGDIHPSQSATILDSREEGLAAEDMVWGFPGYQGKGLLINARAESITDKRSFRESVLSRRCVIPAKGFYEWSPNKEKYHFEEPGMTLYLAGCFDPQHRFVIITTAANESVLPVHERMPLLIPEKEIGLWVGENADLPAVLQRKPQMLRRWTQYRQMTLFDEENHS